MYITEKKEIGQDKTKIGQNNNATNDAHGIYQLECFSSHRNLLSTASSEKETRLGSTEPEFRSQESGVSSPDQNGPTRS